MNVMTFDTNGSWEGSMLRSNGEELAATEVFLELTPDETLTNFVRLQEDGNTQIPIFPGSLTVNVPGHCLMVMLGETIGMVPVPPVIIWNGRDISESVSSLRLQFDYDTNAVSVIISESQVVTTELLASNSW